MIKQAQFRKHLLVAIVGVQLCRVTLGQTPIIHTAWDAQDQGGSFYPTWAALDRNGNLIIAQTNIDENFNGVIYTIKYDGSTGAQLWSTGFKDSLNGDDVAQDIAVDNNGDVIVTGYAAVNSPDDTGWYTVKYSGVDGSEIWTQRFKGPNQYDKANALVVDSSGDIVVTGKTEIDPLTGYTSILTIKYRGTDGAGLWEQQIDSGYSEGSDIYVDSLDNIIVKGHVDVIKYQSTTGDLLWYALYEGPGNGASTTGGAAIDGAGNVIVTGISADQPNLPDGDVYAVKYSGQSGAIIWERADRWAPSNLAGQVFVDANDNVTIVGESDSDVSHVELRKFAAVDGALIWSKQLAPDRSTQLTDAASTGTGHILVTGISQDLGASTVSGYTAKVSEFDGRLIWEKEEPSHGGGSVLVDAFKNTIVAGKSSPYESFRTKYVDKLLGNISTRMAVGTGDNVMIAGFIIAGPDPKTVIIRGIGPSLHVSGFLPDPFLELHDASGAVIGSNDNWGEGPSREDLIDSGFAPVDEAEAAVLQTLEPGAYTAILSGSHDTTGIGLVEAYDYSVANNSDLRNISTRGLIQTGDNVLIGGLIALGTEPSKILIRGLGPSLPVAGSLANPTLEVYDGNGLLLAQNDDWRSENEEAIMATSLAPLDDRESAVLATLNPGPYTAVMRGQDDSIGIGLVEAYQLGN